MIENLTAVEFTPWCPWYERWAVNCRESPGVYLLAVGVGAGDEVDALDGRIIYIGQTSRELDRRWRYFGEAAEGREASHSGGRRFRHHHLSLTDLSVAAWAPGIVDKHLREAYVRYVERRLLLEWVMKHNTLPLCNGE